MASPSIVPPVSPAITRALRKLAERWADAKARERANYQLYSSELCAALGVEGPRPAGSGYEFEFPIKVINRDGKETDNFIDLYKADHFVLEAKNREAGRSDEVMLRKAFGQARGYVTYLRISAIVNTRIGHRERRRPGAKRRSAVALEGALMGVQVWEGPPSGLRRDGPFSTRRWQLDRRRSQMASAVVGSPI